MKEEDLKLIASVGDWSDVNKLMAQICYEQFGKLLEHKLDSIQTSKIPIKECIKQAYGSSKVPTTPMRMNPTKKLLDQIHLMKTVCFESDDEEDEKQDVQPAQVFKTPVLNGKDIKKKTAKTPTTAPSKVVRQSTRLQKIKEMQVKTNHAQKQREELLKEKAERAKRELEERRQRVEQNNRRLEQEKREREELLRTKTNSPFASSASKSTMPKFVPLPFFHPSPSPPLLSKNIRAIIDSSSESCEAVPETPSPGARRMAFSSKKSLNRTEEIINDSLASHIINQQTVDADKINGSDLSSPPPNAVKWQPARLIPVSLTDYDVNDLSSNDATDDDENPRKVIPQWARPNDLMKHVISMNRLLDQTQREHHFGKIAEPKLCLLFLGYLPKKQPTRKSKVSAIWESPLTDPRAGQSRFQLFSQSNPRSDSKKK